MFVVDRPKVLELFIYTRDKCEVGDVRLSNRFYVFFYPSMTLYFTCHKRRNIGVKLFSH